MSAKEISTLKQEAGANKVIPAKYKTPILTALSAYPELKDIEIHFKLTNKHPVPYGTTPTFASLFRPANKRVYYITILEDAKEPERSALLKNLPKEAQVAVIAHELVHVLQFNACSISDLLKTILLYPLPFFKRAMERNADTGAILHGFGKELYQQAVYVRGIPGYLKQRPGLDKYYLKPEEILDKIKK